MIKISRPFKHLLLLLGICLSVAFLVKPSTPSYAGAFGHPCTCASTLCCTISCCVRNASCAIGACVCTSNNETQQTIPHMTTEFLVHRRWLTEVFWAGHILPSLMLMTEQLSTAAIQQTLGIGMLFDAKHQLESQRILQDMRAQAHKDYHPSEGLCAFGTNVRSLAASHRNAEFTQLALSKRVMDRQLLTGDNLTAGSRTSDRESRWVQYKQLYCSTDDMGTGFGNLCTGTGTGANANRENRDIDFAALVDAPETLELDFTPAANADHTPRGGTADEEDIFALMANLYGHKIIQKLPENDFMADNNGNPITEGSLLYMDIRSLIAKRNVAQSSLSAIAGMKAQGETEVVPYMRAVMRDMGIADVDLDEILGPRPSYDMQMKFLTQRLYQHNFFENLYDKPVNVDRKDVAMQAIGLMQKRDIYKSQLRSEMIQSIWLETALDDLEEKYISAEGAVEPGRLLDELLTVLP